MQEDNFIPHDNIDPDAFVNVLNEDTACHIKDSTDDQSIAYDYWKAHAIMATNDYLLDNDTLVPNQDISSFDNDNESANTMSFNLTLLNDNNFNCADITQDDSSGSSTAIPHDNLDDAYHYSRPPPEPPPALIPEITFASAAPIL